LIGGCVLALLGARHRWRELGLCVGVFTAALVAFPILYAYHEYYYIANAVLLMIALGLVLVALAESPCPRWLVALAVVTVVAGQAYAYFDRYYPVQSAISPGGDGLTQSLRALTEPNEVIVVTGQDWNAMTPYYSQRRALMLRRDVEFDPAQADRALANLAGEKIGALVIAGPLDGHEWLIQRLVARGLDPTPLYLWRDVSVFLPAARRQLNADRLEENAFFEVHFAPGVQPPHGYPLNAWWEVKNLWRTDKENFDGMTPTPVRFLSTFGLTLERAAGRMDFGAHPVTRLVFALPAGRHVLHTTVQFSPDAYRDDLAETEATDGVEITLSALTAAGTSRVLDTRIVDPRHRAADRGRKPLRIEFTLPQAGEVELFIGPGPAGRSTRDWVMLGRLVID
jgi:hypothetical protein